MHISTSLPMNQFWAETYWWHPIVRWFVQYFVFCLCLIICQRLYLWLYLCICIWLYHNPCNTRIYKPTCSSDRLSVVLLLYSSFLCLRCCQNLCIWPLSLSPYLLPWGTFKPTCSSNELPVVLLLYSSLSMSLFSLLSISLSLAFVFVSLPSPIRKL